jgi:acyl-CoA synthetase (AMP-forming)/AMP-acid ligase II
MMVRKLTLDHLIERNAYLYPEHPALLIDGRVITHAQMAERVRRIGSALARGLPQQSRVAVLSQNSAEYIEIMNGVHISGLILVTLNWRLAAPELRSIMQDCEPAAFIFESRYAAAATELRAGRLAERFICIGEGPAWAERYEDIVATGDALGPARRASPYDTASLIYTSGTTGRPKGVMLSHRGLFSGALSNCMIGNARLTDRVLITMPLYHVGATIMYFGYAVVGASVVLHPNFDAVRSLKAIESERVTHLHTAPTMIHQLLEETSRAIYDTSSLTNLLYSSSPMSETLLRRGIARFGRIFTQIYGLTECVGGTSLQAHQHVLDGDPKMVARLLSAGQPNYDSEIRIIRGDGEPCRPGEVGEIVLSSPSLMQGYWNNTVMTLQVMRDGWFHTGDLGSMDDEGFVFIVDRKKDMIVSGGENIYSREVEAALVAHPDVAEAAVIGVPDPKWGESVKAFVVRRPGALIDAEALIAHCRSQIASYKKPRSVEFVPAIPQLPSGKVDKKVLRAPYWDKDERQV